MHFIVSVTVGLLLLSCASAQQLTKQQLKDRFIRTWQNTAKERDLSRGEKVLLGLLEAKGLEVFTNEGTVYAKQAAAAIPRSSGDRGQDGQDGRDASIRPDVFSAGGFPPLSRPAINPFGDLSNLAAAEATLDRRWDGVSRVRINSAGAAGAPGGGGRFAGGPDGEREPPRRIDPATHITPLEFAERVANELGDGELNDLPVRKEYRCLSQREKEAFHSAVNRLKFNISMGDSDSAYNAFVVLHNQELAPAAHIGPAFLPWHRHFLWLFERALKEASGDETMTLPYWDFTMDGELGNPLDSVMWTPGHMGTGNGPVVQGPFRDWQAFPSGALQRGVPNHVNFLPDDATVDDTQAVSTYRNYYEPLEFDVHNGPHMHVGGFTGQMGNPTISPNDPMFWMLHAFVDCLWEEWREEHEYPNNVDPVGAYPSVPGPHGAEETMLPFERLQNTDGLSRIYTRLFYRCQHRRTCPSSDNTATAAPPVTCRHEGREYRVGETIPTRQRCIDCVCGPSGEMSCARRSCPRISCQGSYWYTPRGQCCPICAIPAGR